MFCPFEQLTIRHKVSNRNQYRLREVSRPVFSRYLFFSGDRLWDVKRARGVIDLVRAGEHVLAVPDSVMGRLRALADDSGLCAVKDMTRPSLTFRGKVGDAVRLGGGSPFSGFVGRISSLARLDETGEVVAWVEMLGREHELVFDVNEIERVIPKALTAAAAA